MQLCSRIECWRQVVQNRFLPPQVCRTTLQRNVMAQDAAMSNGSFHVTIQHATLISDIFVAAFAIREAVAPRRVYFAPVLRSESRLPTDPCPSPRGPDKPGVFGA